MEVAYGTSRDIESWMELVQEVRWNFPGLETKEALEDHRQTVLRFMDERRALCVKDGESVIGVLLLSQKHNMICCLAVSPQYRRKGIASLLLKKRWQSLIGPGTSPLLPFVKMTKKALHPDGSIKNLALKKETCWKNLAIRCRNLS